jgi:hypothetical protein
MVRACFAEPSSRPPCDTFVSGLANWLLQDGRLVAGWISARAGSTGEVLTSPYGERVGLLNTPPAAEPAGDSHPTCNLNIRSPSLDEALREVGRQCDVQLGLLF